MIPHDIPGYVSGWILNSAHYQAAIGLDRFTGEALDGFADISGYGNPLLLRQGAPAFTTVDGAEHLTLDNTNIFSAKNLMEFSGTLVLVLRDGVNPADFQTIVNFETFRLTKVRPGGVPYVNALTRASAISTLLGTIYGGPSANGATTGTGTRVVLAASADTDGPNWRLRTASGSADVTSGMNALANGALGADIVFGRLVGTESDAARTALAGTRRLQLREAHLFATIPNTETSALLNNFMAQLAA